jgi:hypothetical protein
VFQTLGCNTFRNWKPIENTWDSIKSIVQHWIKYDETLSDNLGGYNDPDVILGGNTSQKGPLPDNILKLQFSIWAVLSAPLVLSSDLRTMPQNTQKILLNKEVIAVNQDRRWTNRGKSVGGTNFARRIMYGAAAVFSNLEDSTLPNSAPWVMDLRYESGKSFCYDLWADERTNMCEDLTKGFENNDWKIMYVNSGKGLQVTAKNVERRSVRMIKVLFIPQTGRFIARAEDM